MVDKSLNPSPSLQTSKKSGKQDQPSPGSFSTLPTNPRDWIVMDMLPGELGHWQSSAMYILGDRAVLQDIPEDLYPSCTFVPVEVSTLLLRVDGRDSRES